MRGHDASAFQDLMRDNFCFGCGSDNPDGLQIKSVWSVDDPETAVAEWVPLPAHSAGPRSVLNGGIIATVVDCPGIGTAIADAYSREDRAIGTDPEIWYATASISVEYLRPAPIAATCSLVARVVAIEDRFTTVEVELAASDKPRARATVRAVRVPDSWRHGARA